MIITVMFLLAGSLITVGSVSSPVLKDIKIVRNLEESKQSFSLSEGAVEDLVYRVINGISFSDTEVLSVNGVTATTTTTVLADERKIISVGDKDNVIRTTQAILKQGVGASFNYGLQVGEGGIEVKGDNVQIIGNIYSNGSIDGDTGFNITGDAIVAGGTALTPDQQWLVQNDDFIFGKTVGSEDQIDAAQSFKISDEEDLNKISIYIKKVGNPSNITIQINKDKDGSPGEKGGDVVVQGVLQASSVTDTYVWIDVGFSSTPELDDDKTYWIVADASDDENNYWVWGTDNTNAYPDGSGKYNDDWEDKNNWDNIVGDLNFKIWLAGDITSIEDATVGLDVYANTIDSVTAGGDAYGQTISDTTVGGNVYANSLSSCTIGGDAYYNSISSCTVGGSSTSSTTPPSDMPPQVWPISDANIASFKADAQAGTLISGDYVLGQDESGSLGPAKITGDLILDKDSHLTVTGTIWVEGSIDIEKETQVELYPGYGTNSGVIVADGNMHIDKEGYLAGSEDPNSFVMFIILATSGTHHNAAIDFHEDTTVEGIIFAPNGKVNLHKDVHLTQLTAYSIEIDKDSTIEYDTGLVNVVFTSGPSGGYGIESWLEI